MNVEPFELGSAQTRSWRTASNGFAGIRFDLRSSAKPFVYYGAHTMVP